MKKYLIFMAIAVVFSGCCCVTPHVETVVDRVYVPKQCPTFNNELQISGKKYKTNVVYDDSVIIPVDTLLTSLEKNKMARQTFNTNIKHSNKIVKVPGKPQTSNFVRVEKRIFVERDCPLYIYRPTIKAKKLTSSFKKDNNTTYVVIKTDKLIESLEKNKMAKQKYNQDIKKINSYSFVEKAKEKFDSVIKITTDKISDTTKKIKEKVKNTSY